MKYKTTTIKQRIEHYDTPPIQNWRHIAALINELGQVIGQQRLPELRPNYIMR